MGEMNERGQFTFYRSYYEALKTLTKRDRLAAYDAIVAYALDGALPALSGAAATAFILIRPVLDTGRKRARAGRLGGEAGGKQALGPGPGPDRQTAREREDEKENEKENEAETERESPGAGSRPDNTRRERFVPPSLEEVAAYVRDRHSPVDPGRFVDFYAAKGWMMGKNPMRDWQAALRSWEQRDRAGQGERVSAAPDAGELARMRKLRERMKAGG